jgi:membrane-associated phospholipid phosphatase
MNSCFFVFQMYLLDSMKKKYHLPLGRFIAARCSPEGEFGLHLTQGVLLLLLAAWLFGRIADQVMGGATTLGWIHWLDSEFAHYLQAQATPMLTALMLTITHLHGIVGNSILGVLLCAYFAWKKLPYWLLTTALALPVGMLLNLLLKYTFMRARPVSDDAILTLASYSFPSGHTAASTLLYGIIAAYLVCLSPRFSVRGAIIAAAVLMVALVGLSRVYLGVHYASDVLAAVVESCGWLAVCITAISTLRRRRAAADQRRRAADQRGSLS